MLDPKTSEALAKQIADQLPYFLAFMQHPPLKIMQRITPQEMESALEAKGWAEVGRTDEISAWMLGGKQGVAVPLNPDFVDYPHRVVEILRKLYRDEVNCLIESVLKDTSDAS
jgi:hypothetical protein